jgi:hypothetical protein
VCSAGTALCLSVANKCEGRLTPIGGLGSATGEALCWKGADGGGARLMPIGGFGRSAGKADVC